MNHILMSYALKNNLGNDIITNVCVIFFFIMEFFHCSYDVSVSDHLILGTIMGLSLNVVVQASKFRYQSCFICTQCTCIWLFMTFVWKM